MPDKPSWPLRVNDILTDLSRPELTSLPFLSRAAIEKHFGLQRRQAIQIITCHRRLPSRQGVRHSAAAPHRLAGRPLRLATNSTGKTHGAAGRGASRVHAVKPWH